MFVRQTDESGYVPARQTGMFGDEDARTKSLTQTDEVDDYVAARPTGLFGNLVDVAQKDTLGSNFTLETQEN